MQFNYSFEIASLLFLLLIAVHFLSVRQFPTAKTRVFGMLLLVCIGESIFHILVSAGLANADFVPQGVNKMLAFVFFAFEGFSSVLIYKYTVVICRLEPQQKKTARTIGLVLGGIYCLVLLLTPFLGLFYYFENNRYYRGPGSYFGYLYVGVFFVLNIVLILSRQKYVNLGERLMVLSYTVIAIGAIVIQCKNPGTLLTSFANAVMICLIYLSIQNPGEMFDTVTGIGNETALESQLQDLLERKKNGIVIVVNVKQYHQINLLFGMENCNRLLTDIGQYFYQLGGKFHVFRSNINTFVILTDEMHDRDFTESITKRFSKEWQVEENRILVDYAMVLLHCPKDFSTIPEFLGICDYMLRSAGSPGSHAPLEADEQIINGYYRQNDVQLALERAIKEKSIQVYYQPIYSLKEKRIVALEALCRLYDEKLGFIPPDEFIPMAEKSGDIVKIGEIVLEECCSFLAKHVLSNVTLGIESIQVNISVAQCMQQDLKEAVLPILQKYHIPASMIVLELTETTAINAPSLMERHMRELGNAGISFAMDDYGNGNANCSYLMRYPFREVKIDKEMTWAYFENETARIVLQNEIATMHKLGIPMVVEGIEKLEQSQEMERLGVEYIQGYFYGKPLPEMECLRYIRQFNFASEDYGR